MPKTKIKARPTRQHRQKQRRLDQVLKSFCWLTAFCLIVSLIKIATVLVIRGSRAEYFSVNSALFLRLEIIAHAVIALVAILARRRFSLLIAPIFAIALFVLTLTTPIYAELRQCDSSIKTSPCNTTLIYQKYNIYNLILK